MRIYITDHFKERLLERFGLGFNHEVFLETADATNNFLDKNDVDYGYSEISINVSSTNLECVVRRSSQGLTLLTCFRRKKCGRKKWLKIVRKKKKKNIRYSKVKKDYLTGPVKY